ncbi:MAG: putative Ig protein, partial [Verrucomicrobiaceae bacterium]|nr:putative Ig protein [Verrucomicrobiaceae bacterium]
EPVKASLMVHALPENAVGTFNALVDRSTTLSAPIVTPAGQKLKNHGGSLDNMVVTSVGTFTATLKLEDKSYAMPAGTALNANQGANPTARVVIKRGTGIADLVVNLTIDKTTGKLTGDLSDGLVGTPVKLQGWRNTWKTTGTAASPAHPATALAGTYTTALELADPALLNDLAYPQGNGYATVTVTAAGSVTWTGVLADGTSVSRTTTLGPNGEVPLHWLLYTTVATTAGSAYGWLQVKPGSLLDKPDDNLLDTVLDLTQADPEDQHLFDWKKEVQLSSSTTRSYKSGFSLHKLKAVGGGYVKPSTVVLGFGNPPNNASLTFSGANVETSVTYLNANNATNPGPSGSMDGKVFSLSTANVATMPSLPTAAVANPAALSLKLTTTSGAMSGTFSLKADPDPTNTAIKLDRLAVPFTGVLVQRLSKGVGCFQLQQMPTASPKTTLSTSPKLSGQVLLESAH